MYLYPNLSLPSEFVNLKVLTKKRMENAGKLSQAEIGSTVVKKSETTGEMITGFKAEVNPAALGVGLQAMIAVRLKRHYKPDVEAFREHALALPEVVRLYHVAGPIDFLAHVWTRDSGHLRDLAMTAFTSREEVAHIETELIFEHVSCQELPQFLDHD